MTAYLIANIEVTNPEAFARYREQVAPMIARFGGRYLIRGGAVHPKEGDLGLKRLIVLEFPSMDAAETFYNSADYAPLLALRLGASISHAALVEGYAG